MIDQYFICTFPKSNKFSGSRFDSFGTQATNSFSRLHNKPLNGQCYMNCFVHYYLFIQKFLSNFVQNLILTEIFHRSFVCALFFIIFQSNFNITIF